MAFKVLGPLGSERYRNMFWVSRQGFFYVGCVDSVVRMAVIDDGAADSRLAPFLALLERDMAARPEALASLGSDLADRMRAATEGVEGCVDGSIEGDVAL